MCSTFLDGQVFPLRRLIVRVGEEARGESVLALVGVAIGAMGSGRRRENADTGTKIFYLFDQSR